MDQYAGRYGRAKKGGKVKMQNRAGRRPLRGPLWIIEGTQSYRTEIFTLDPDSDGGFLPVFTFREEAEAFLHLVVEADGDRRARGEWRLRETAPGEVVSVLFGPCAGARRVTLDPPPVFEVEMLALASMDRQRFARYLIGEDDTIRDSLGEEEKKPLGRFRNSLAGET